LCCVCGYGLCVACVATVFVLRVWLRSYSDACVCVLFACVATVVL
jgi:hypothetical protein